MVSASPLPWVRRALALTMLATMAGAVADLFLVEHTEDIWQIVPIALLVVATVVLVLAWIRPNKTTMNIVQVVMVAIIVAGAIGLWLHYRANAEFELEMYPAMAGWALFWKAIHGAAPPSLAPGAMFLIGTLGLIWSYSGETT